MKDYKQGMIDAYTKIIALINTLDPKAKNELAQTAKTKAEILRDACFSIQETSKNCKSGYKEYLEKTKNLSESN